MRRKEILKRLGYEFPEKYSKRVIICTDAHNEADDQFAITHHLLTPCENILGIVASHYEFMTRNKCNEAKQLGWSEAELKKHLEDYLFAPLNGSMDMSYKEIQKVLSLLEIDDIPVYAGAKSPLTNYGDIPQSEGADFIIREAMKKDEGKLYVCFLGAITDMAIALAKNPEIADNVVIIWIGGGKYPNGGEEFNLMQDVIAANKVFSSEAEVWQIPKDAYTKVVVSFSELMTKFYPHGKIGKYLTENLFKFHRDVVLGCNSNPVHRDTWILGDNPTVSVLAIETFGEDYELINAPIINSDYSYSKNVHGKLIRVYNRVHERFIIEDLATKIAICY